MLLTRLVRGTAIWNVYVATSPQGDATSRTNLEFEDTSARSLRYSRRAEGALLHALFNGAPVSRATLQGELEQALVAAGVIEAGEGAEHAAVSADTTDGSVAAGPAEADMPTAVEAPQPSAAPNVDEAAATADAIDEPAPAETVNDGEIAKTAKAAKAPSAAKAPRAARTSRAAKTPKAVKATRAVGAPRTPRAAKAADTPADTDPAPVEAQPAADGPLSRSG